MSRKACPTPDEACPYFTRRTPPELRGQQEHGCFSDRDHIIPRFVGKLATEHREIVNEYINSDTNKQQICRWEHEEKSYQELLNPPELPPLEVMIEAINKERIARYE